MSKVTKIISEIHNFFSENRISPVMETFTNLLESLPVNSRMLGGEKRDNCQLTNLQVFQLLVLLPFFAITGFSHYPDSILSRMFGGKKDILYSFMSRDTVDWRSVVYRITGFLMKKIAVRKDYVRSHLPRVLIADDTDLPKTGMHIEAIGKVFSHVHQKCILGFKALVLCWSDGRTQLAVDFSLHGEKGKIEGKEQGLTAEQRGKRYSREREEGCHAEMRKDEYFVSKGERLIAMVKKAIKVRIPFDYLLVDSWFTNTALVEFVRRSRYGFHLLGMARMGKTKYGTEEWGEQNAKSIIDRLVKGKKVKRSRKYRCQYTSVKATLGKRKVLLLFCRKAKQEGWKLLLTTDLDLDFMKAYEIYAMRWSIEVFFSDSKKHLDLAGCSARDFSAQISHVSLVMIRYNLMAFVKRSMDYETIGCLFRDLYDGVHEMTVIEKIWEIIVEVITVVADLLGLDDETLLTQVIEDDRRLAALREYARTA